MHTPRCCARSALTLAMLIALLDASVSAEEGRAMTDEGSTVTKPVEDPFVEQILKIAPDLMMEKRNVGDREVPAYVVAMRAKAGDRKPAIVLLHGGGPGDSDKRQTFGLEWPGLHWPQDLARMGYLVVCTDGWGSGDHPGVADAAALKEASFVMRMAPRLRETAKDAASVHAYLAAREDVDADRIALMGISAGGMSALAAAMERAPFAAYVVVNSAADFLNPIWKDSWVYQRRGMSDELQIPEADAAAIRAIDPLYFPEKIAPQPLLLLHGKYDRLALPVLTEGLYAALLPLYAAHPEHLERKVMEAYPLPEDRAPDVTETLMTHVPTPGMTQYAYDWLERILSERG